ncbi:MAG TPA: hypothetical protein VNO24_13700, partial [Blastocatellia bacterium]|nr:hypothetical protein [Blastocatellia bacterium]
NGSIPPTFCLAGNTRRTIFAVERWGDLESESPQILDRQSAGFAMSQMIGNRLELFAGQVPIDKSSRLFGSRVGAHLVS